MPSAFMVSPPGRDTLMFLEQRVFELTLKQGPSQFQRDPKLPLRLGNFLVVPQVLQGAMLCFFDFLVEP